MLTYCAVFGLQYLKASKQGITYCVVLYGIKTVNKVSLQCFTKSRSEREAKPEV